MQWPSPTKVHKVVAAVQPFANKVLEYHPAPSQYMNTSTTAYKEGFTYEQVLEYATQRIQDRLLLSLGGFGGNIIVGFNQPIRNIADEYDFKVYGNASYNMYGTGTGKPGGSAEPGIVLVSKDVNGNGRELHTELAKDAIDYTLYPDYRTHYKGHTNATVELADCKYFTTNLLDLDTIMVRNFSELDSFVVYICMAGKASIRDNKGNEIFVHQGQTVLIPADTEVITISPAPGAKFMETYIGQ